MDIEALAALIQQLDNANVAFTGGAPDGAVYFKLPGDEQPDDYRVLDFEAQHLVAAGISNLTAVTSHYEAIYNKDSRTAECYLIAAGAPEGMTAPKLWQHPQAEIFDNFKDMHTPADEEQSDESSGLYSFVTRVTRSAVGWRIAVTDGENEIEISPVSRALFALHPSLEQLPLSIKATGPELDATSAKDLLLGAGGDFLFNLNLSLGLDLQFKSRSIGRVTTRPRIASTSLAFPSFKYSRTSRELYWYASTASEFPLVQFLAYYQILEHNFYRFSRISSIRKARNLLRDPRFSTTNDQDLMGLVAAVEAPSSRKREIELLADTLEQCVDIGHLRSFLESEGGKSLTLRKQSLRGVKPIDTSSDNIFSSTASMVYALRNRIVHAKDYDDKGDIEALTPTSPDTLHIRPALELLQMLAQSAIIGSASPN
ncbi:hypothetical protein [Curtobacterium oceanosedimentum]|uniref:hypothetical protein n=1 Tax=Curtobacterium oceanosedimentum TaxID=465820 RepID=UPI00128F1380|nr:hypothetical protein [Curtobacterium oceanosedimentum]